MEPMCAQVSYCGLQIAAIASGGRPTGPIDAAEPRSAAGAAAERRLYELIALRGRRCALPLVTIGGFRGRLANAVWTDPSGARAHLVEILGAAAAKAERVGVRLAIEPLNRYESDVVNTAAEGLALIREVGHSHLGLLLDTFHMNIEEPTYAGSIEQGMASGRLWHIHLGDSNRLRRTGAHRFRRSWSHCADGLRRLSIGRALSWRTRIAAARRPGTCCPY
jgi:sugar phosphate isomerase/epimerase